MDQNPIPKGSSFPNPPHSKPHRHPPPPRYLPRFHWLQQNFLTSCQKVISDFERRIQTSLPPNRQSHEIPPHNSWGQILFLKPKRAGSQVLVGPAYKDSFSIKLFSANRMLPSRYLSWTQNAHTRHLDFVLSLSLGFLATRERLAMALIRWMACCQNFPPPAESCRSTAHL